MNRHIFAKLPHGLVIPLVAVLWLVASGAGAASVEVTLTNRSLPELRAQLDAWVNQPRFSGALWSVKIASLDTGRTLYEHHPDRLMSPASNSKLYTGALALDTLGGDYHFKTPLRTTAPVDAQGTVAGDLIISGRDDPSWKAAQFESMFDPFVAVLMKAGVKVVTGNLVADSTFLHGPPTGGSWAVEDVDDSEGAPISALTLADNAADIHVAPGTNAGDPCRVTLTPAGTVLNLVNLTRTVPVGAQSHLELSRAAGTNDFYLLGQLPTGGGVETLDTGVSQPARWFGTALKAALASHGIVIQGTVQVVTWPETPLWNPAGLYTLGEIQSPPLREVVRSFMKPSQNLEADLVFDHVGELMREPGTPEWVTSEELAVRALDRFLRQHGIPHDVHFDEGSGMSRNNLASANATVALLTVMATNRWAADYYAALPIAGVDGTLRSRMKNSPAFGKVHAKTGTLRWVNSLSGYVTSAAGEKLVFSLMLNRYASPPDRRRTDELDEIAGTLAAFQGRSNE